MVVKPIINRNSKRQRPDDIMRLPRQRKLRFVDGKLYKIIKEERAAGLVKMYDYKEDKIVIMLRSDVFKKGQLTFNKWEVCDLLDISINTLEKWQKRYDLPRATPLSRGEIGLRIHSYFSEDDIFEIRERMAMIAALTKWNTNKVASKLLTEEELATKMGRRLGVYIKDSNGEFIPIWQAKI